MNLPMYVASETSVWIGRVVAAVQELSRWRRDGSAVAVARVGQQGDGWKRA